VFSDLPPSSVDPSAKRSSVATIDEAIAEYKAGRMVIVMDDEDRENEGDLCMAAEKVTPEAINFMATEGRGLICLPVTEQKLRHGLPMEQDGRPLRDAPYCLKNTWGAELYGIDARPGEEIVVKHRYSGFKGTNLDLLLRSAGVQTVILTGVATNACVESTGRDVYMHDYYLVFVSDGTATTSPAAHDATLANIDQFFGQVATIDAIVAAWAAAPARARAVAVGR